MRYKNVLHKNDVGNVVLDHRANGPPCSRSCAARWITAGVPIPLGCRTSIAKTLDPHARDDRSSASRCRGSPSTSRSATIRRHRSHQPVLARRARGYRDGSGALARVTSATTGALVRRRPASSGPCGRQSCPGRARMVWGHRRVRLGRERAAALQSRSPDPRAARPEDPPASPHRARPRASAGVADVDSNGHYPQSTNEWRACRPRAPLP
jgi:hypothetical protein